MSLANLVLPSELIQDVPSQGRPDFSRTHLLGEQDGPEDPTKKKPTPNTPTRSQKVVGALKGAAKGALTHGAAGLPFGAAPATAAVGAARGAIKGWQDPTGEKAAAEKAKGKIGKVEAAARGIVGAKIPGADEGDKKDKGAEDKPDAADTKPEDQADKKPDADKKPPVKNADPNDPESHHEVDIAGHGKKRITRTLNGPPTGQLKPHGGPGHEEVFVDESGRMFAPANHPIHQVGPHGLASMTQVGAGGAPGGGVPAWMGGGAPAGGVPAWMQGGGGGVGAFMQQQGGAQAPADAGGGDQAAQQQQAPWWQRAGQAVFKSVDAQRQQALQNQQKATPQPGTAATGQQGAPAQPATPPAASAAGTPNAPAPAPAQQPAPAPAPQPQQAQQPAPEAAPAPAPQQAPAPAQQGQQAPTGTGSAPAPSKKATQPKATPGTAEAPAPGEEPKTTGQPAKPATPEKTVTDTQKKLGVEPAPKEPQAKPEAEQPAAGEETPQAGSDKEKQAYQSAADALKRQRLGGEAGDLASRLGLPKQGEKPTPGASEPEPKPKEKPAPEGTSVKTTGRSGEAPAAEKQSFELAQPPMANLGKKEAQQKLLGVQKQYGAGSPEFEKAHREYTQAHGQTDNSTGIREPQVPAKPGTTTSKSTDTSSDAARMAAAATAAKKTAASGGADAGRVGNPERAAAVAKHAQDWENLKGASHQEKALSMIDVPREHRNPTMSRRYYQSLRDSIAEKHPEVADAMKNHQRFRRTMNNIEDDVRNDPAYTQLKTPQERLDFKITKLAQEFGADSGSMADRIKQGAEAGSESGAKAAQAAKSMADKVKAKGANFEKIRAGGQSLMKQMGQSNQGGYSARPIARTGTETDVEATPSENPAFDEKLRQKTRERDQKKREQGAQLVASYNPLARTPLLQEWV